MIRSIIQNVRWIQPKLLGQPSLASSLKLATTYDIQSILPPIPHSQQVRTTYILKREKPLPLTKMNNRSRRMRGRHFIYELIENENTKKENPVKVILTSSVEGLGIKGDVIETTPYRARNHLLLPGLAVYASPENIEKYSYLLNDETEKDQPSSPFARKTASELTSRVISVSMNLNKPWKVEPWHVRVALRKAGIIVPDEALTLPSQPIEGPDLSLQNKEFLVKVKINNKEEAPVRCRINHYTSRIIDRPPYIPFHWEYMAEPIFAEEAEILEKLARENPITRLAEREEQQN